MISFDSNILLNWYQARSGIGSQAAAASAAAAKPVPTAPWSTLSKAPKVDELTTNVLRGRDFIDEDAAKLDVKGASEDYRKLFAMHQGLATLEAIAKQADADGVTASDLKRLQAAFDRGAAEISKYIDTAKFETLRLTHGDAADKAKMTVGVPKTKAAYVTAPLHVGDANAEVAAFQGPVQFRMEVKGLGGSTGAVDFDLAEMGATPRTMSNVVKYMNDKATAAGYYTRFTVERSKTEAKEITVNGKPVTVAAAQDQFALKIQGDTTEKISFSAVATAPAVYLTQTVGDPDPDGKSTTDDGVLVQQFMKFETGAASDAVRRPGDQNWVDGRVFSQDLPKGVESIRSTVTGPDGAVYMLADISAETDGQTIKGASDVALLKYDSAGSLVYTRTLGAADKASGLGLTVAADGRIAISGSVTGALDKGEDGADATKPDSFVTVLDAQGQEVWTERSSARDADEATSVAFGADGSVYVLGRAKGSLPGASSAGGYDNYLRSYDATGKLLSTVQFGGSGDDKPAGLVVDGGAVVVASVEGGEVQLRRFDVTDPTKPTLSATRNLGSLGGGSFAGIAMDGGALVIGGSSTGALGIGGVTRAASGDMDAFAARISADLSAGGDQIAYYGGTGQDRATAMTVSGGKVWLTGYSKGEIAGLTKIGEQDGFVAELDVGAGSVGFAQRYTAKDGIVAPSTIAVAATGASVLDRLGLPSGTVEYSDSQLLTAATAVRAGDQFQIKRGNGRASTITIEAKDTLDTLAAKVRRATGYAVKVDIVTDGDVRKLQIKPMNERSTLEILGGIGGRDALEALGLQEGFVRATTYEDGVAKPADGGAPIYGLKLARDLSIASEDDIRVTMDELSLALSTIRKAYRDMQAAATPKDPLADLKGEAPAYLKAKLANYQAGLSRLTGGG